MPRSVWKGPYVEKSLIKVFRRSLSNNRGMIKTRCRSSVILPDFVGFVIHVYNGKRHIPVKVVEQMVGHKLGEFAPTREFRGHAVDQKIKRR